MKKLLLLLFCALPLAVFAQKGYTVRGEVANIPDGHVAVLLEPIKGGTDTVEVRDGRFLFSGEVGYPAVTTLWIGERNAPNDDYMLSLNFVVTNDDIVVAGDFDGEVTVSSPSPLHDKFKKIEQRAIEIFVAEGKAAVYSYLLETIGERIDDAVELIFTTMLDDRLDDLQRLVPTIPPAMQGDPITVSLLATIEILKVSKVAAGERYVPLSLPAPDGNIVSTDSLLREKRCLLLDFWASWCVRCLEDLPRLKQLYDSYNAAHDNGLEVYSISIDDDRQAWLRGVEKAQFRWPSVSWMDGRTEAVSMRCGFGIPAYVLVDADGVVLYSGGDLNEVEKALAKLLM